MNKSRVLQNYISMNWKDLGPFGMLVSSIFYTVGFLISPPVAKLMLDAAIEDLREKGFVTIRRCSIAEMNLRTQAEDHLKSLLRKNSDYVNMMSDGDRAKIIASGYDVYTPEYSANPTVFTVKQGIFSGQVIAQWPTDPNNHGYMFRYSINEEGLRDVFTEVNAGNTECTVDGLTPGKVYIFS